MILGLTFDLFLVKVIAMTFYKIITNLSKVLIDNILKSQDVVDLVL